MLEVNNLSKSYGKKNIFNSVSFVAENSCIVGLLGKNGSGKSTLISILAGLLSANEGSCFWDKHDILKDTKFRTKISGYVPQKLTLFDELSALDNLKLWTKENNKFIENFLNSGSLRFLEINDFLKVKVSKLSGGMKKRLSIACAVLNSPKLLLLDEPSSSLDILCRAQIRNYLTAFKNEGGTIVLVTHDVDEIKICDKCFMLSNGILKPYNFSGNQTDLEKDLTETK